MTLHQTPAAKDNSKQVLKTVKNWDGQALLARIHTCSGEPLNFRSGSAERLPDSAAKRILERFHQNQGAMHPQALYLSPISTQQYRTVEPEHYLNYDRPRVRREPSENTVMMIECRLNPSGFHLGVLHAVLVVEMKVFPPSSVAMRPKTRWSVIFSLSDSGGDRRAILSRIGVACAVLRK